MSRVITYATKSGIATLTAETNTGTFKCQIQESALTFLNSLFTQEGLPEFKDWIHHTTSEKLADFFALIYGIHILSITDMISNIADNIATDLMMIEIETIGYAESIGLDPNDVFGINQSICCSYLYEGGKAVSIISEYEIHNNWSDIYNQFDSYKKM